jgi:flagellar basal-body rod protein FlgC
MSLNKIFAGMQISSSGLAGERLRMEVAANNIANVHSTRTAEGGAYRRQRVSFQAVMNDTLSANVSPDADTLRGVRVLGVTPDESPLTKVHDPGHPDADESGFVELPNVSLPQEMVDLVTASRAYEANLKSMETFRQMAEQSLALLRDGR